MRRLKTELESVSIHGGALILVNAANPFLPFNNLRSEAVDSRYPEIEMEHNAARMLQKVLALIEESKRIVPVSGYRSRFEQKVIWDDTVCCRGQKFAQKYVALPGYSEHQTGLAIDLGYRDCREGLDTLCPAFPYDGVCGSFRKIALRYGFIERYSKGKENITGIAHEPWHFRYVGFPHSVIMQIYDLCHEEYIDFVRDFSSCAPLCYYTDSYKIEVFSADSVNEIQDDGGYIQISGNNIDKYIVTRWIWRYD